MMRFAGLLCPVHGALVTCIHTYSRCISLTLWQLKSRPGHVQHGHRLDGCCQGYEVRNKIGTFDVVTGSICSNCSITPMHHVVQRHCSS